MASEAVDPLIAHMSAKDRLIPRRFLPTAHRVPPIKEPPVWRRLQRPGLSRCIIVCLILLELAPGESG